MSEQQLPTRLVFRVPQVSILAALLVAICATPMAAALPVLAVIYVIPIAAIVWVLRVRTVADASGLTVRKIAGSADVAWDDLKGLLLNPKGTVTAVRKDDTRLPLPSVRTRHLPALSVISGGRITDPTDTTPAETPPADATDPAPQAVETPPTDTTGPPPLPGGTALGQSTGGEGSEDRSSTGGTDPAARDTRTVADN